MQTDLTVEADNYERFGVNFASYPDVVFPKIHRSLSRPNPSTSASAFTSEPSSRRRAQLM